MAAVEYTAEYATSVFIVRVSSSGASTRERYLTGVPMTCDNAPVSESNGQDSNISYSESGDLFGMIEGLASEDLSTAILAFLLSSDNHRAFQRLFLSRVTGDARRIGGYSVTLQPDFGPAGRGDLLLENSEYRVLVENKFYASFSGQDQLVRYARHLAETCDEDQAAILVLLTVADRQEYYVSTLASHFRAVRSSQSVDESLSLVCLHMRQIGVDFLALSWEDVLSDFTCGNDIADALSVYIRERFVRSTALTSEERIMMESDLVPDLMEKLWAIVDKVKDALGSGGRSTGRTSQSRLFYGFAVHESWGDIWVGTYMTAWKSYQSALCLQIRRDWMRAAARADTIGALLGELGFKESSELEFVFPISVPEDHDAVNAIVSAYQSVSAEIDKHFEADYQ